jgi:hypothetical protein
MNLLKDRYPWALELLTKEIIDQSDENDSLIQEALFILSPKYIECCNLYKKNLKNKVIKHNYHLLSAIYELLLINKKNRRKNYEYIEIKKLSKAS